MTDSRFMPCEEWAEKLTMFPDDLSPSDRVALDAHLQSCSKCAEFLKDDETIRSLLDILPVPEFSATLPLALQQLLREDREEVNSIVSLQISGKSNLPVALDLPHGLTSGQETREIRTVTHEPQPFDMSVQKISSEESESPNTTGTRDISEATKMQDEATKMQDRTTTLSASMEDIDTQIAALNEADIAFRLAEWHCQEAQTENEQRRYARASLEDIDTQIAALNKADIAFRLAEWHCREAQTENEQRRYARASLYAAMQRAFIFTWLERHQIVLKKLKGIYISEGVTT
jgi:Putative zinc-finger